MDPHGTDYNMAGSEVQDNRTIYQRSPKEVARQYIELGLSPIPLGKVGAPMKGGGTHTGKLPILKKWQDASPVSHAALEAMTHQWHGFAINCARSGIVVLDFDLKGSTAEARITSLAKAVADHAGHGEWEAVYKDIWKAIVTRSPSGSLHAYFWADGARIQSKNGLLDGIDLKAGFVGDDGGAVSAGYVVAAPTCVAVNATTGRDTYEGDLPAVGDLPALPDDVRAYLEHQQASKTKRPTSGSNVTPKAKSKTGKRKIKTVGGVDEWTVRAEGMVAGHPVEIDRRYAASGIGRELRGLADLADVGEGNNRNSVLNIASLKIGALVAAVNGDAEEAAEAIADACADWGHDPASVAATIQSGMAKGLANPRAHGGGTTQPTMTRAEATEATDEEGDGLPEGFVLHAGKVCFVSRGEDDDGDAVEHFVPVCSSLRFVARYRGDNGLGWGLAVEITTGDGRTKILPIDNTTTVDMRILKGVLRDAGVWLSTSKGSDARLATLFNNAAPKTLRRRVERMGWQEGCSAFVMPSRTVGHVAGEQFEYVGHGTDDFTARGTLGGWQCSVAALCAGNSLLLLALGASFAGPILRLIGEDGGGFHPFGNSSTGKTTVLRVGASTWGPPSFMKQWRGTENGLEGQALARNDCLMVLDEAHQASAETLSNAVYMLANGAGKARAARDGSARPIVTWKTMVLSSGEVSIDTAIASGRDKKQATAGQGVRMANVPADGGANMGVFQNIHGRSKPKDFADDLRAACIAEHGTAGPALIAWIAANQELAIEIARKEIAAFEKTVVGHDGGDAQLGRVARRFGIVFAALVLACKAGILPWTRKECTKVMDCYASWRLHRGHTGNIEAHKATSSIDGFLSAHDARFVDWAHPNAVVFNRAGFKKVEFAPSTTAAALRQPSPQVTKTTFYIFPAAFSEACQGLEPEQAAKHLKTAGRLVHDAGRLTKRVRLPGGGGAKYVYAVEVLP